MHTRTCTYAHAHMHAQAHTCHELFNAVKKGYFYIHSMDELRGNDAKGNRPGIEEQILQPLLTKMMTLQRSNHKKKRAEQVLQGWEQTAEVTAHTFGYEVTSFL